MGRGSSVVAMHVGHSRLFLLLVIAWMAVRTAQILVAGWGSGSDVRVYKRYATQWGAGKAPYRDFRPEYPPGAVAAFMLPHLAHGRNAYGAGFRGMMLMSDLACFLTLLAWLTGRDSKELVTAAGMYLLYTSVLFPVMYKRFDLLPGLFAALGLYFADKRRAWSKAGALLGFGASLKLWPAVLVPALAVWRWNGIRDQKLRWLALGGLAGMVVPCVFVGYRAGWEVFGFLGYHTGRGIQIASTWSSLALCVDALGLTDVWFQHARGAFHVRGALPSALASVTTTATMVLGLLPIGLAWRCRESVPIALVGCAAVLGMMLGSNVLSPQFLLWLAPLAPLACLDRPWWFLLFLVAAIATTTFYPYYVRELPRQSDGYAIALVALTVRNLALAAAYGLLTAHILRGLPPRDVPGADRLAPT